MGPGQEDLGALTGLAHFVNVKTHLFVRGVRLTGDLFSQRQYRFHISQVHQDLPLISTLYGAENHIAFPVGVYVVNDGTLRFTDLLNYHLFGSLGSDPSEVGRSHFPLHHITQLVVRVQLLRLFQRDSVASS